MNASEPPYDDPGSTAAAVELLRRHDAQEPEANITSAIRDFLTATGLTRANEIVEENPPSDSSRQAVDLTALDTFLESKQRIGTQGNPHPNHIAQLDSYLKQSEDAGRVRMGILTDGKHWLLRWPQAGPVRTVPPYLFTLDSADRWFLLYAWLKNQAFAEPKDIPLDRKSLEDHFSPNSPALQRDIDALRDLYQLNKHRPTIQIKRQLWEDLLRTALGEVAQTPGQMDELFVRHTYLTAVIGMVVQASFGIDLRAMADIEPMSLLDGSRFRDEVGLTAVVESDFFTWPTEEEVGGLPLMQTLARRIARFDWEDAPADVAAILYETVVPPEERRQLGEYYTPDWLATAIVKETVNRSAEPAGPGSSLRVRGIHSRGRQALRGSHTAEWHHKPPRTPSTSCGTPSRESTSTPWQSTSPAPPGSLRPSPSSRQWSMPTSSRTSPSLSTWETLCSCASAPAICSRSMRFAYRSKTS